VPQITTDLPPAGFAYLARGIREAVSVPVAVSNRINRPELAEEALREGFGDLVCMARAMIADAQLPRKTQEGRSEEIRCCIACNQKCFDHVFQLKPIGCLVNAEAGEEFQIRIKPAESPKKVLVVGGGPAGCEAALRAAQRGHKVTLYEKEPHLGGQIRWWNEPTDKPDFAEMIRYYESALPGAGVDVRLAEEVTPELASNGGYDVAWVATGSAPITPNVPGVKSAHVVSAWEVLKGEVNTGRKVVVIGGGAAGLETAIFLAKKGTLSPKQLHFLMLHDAEVPDVLKDLIVKGTKEVTVIEMLPKVGKDIGPSTRWVVLKKLDLYGVKVMTKTRLLEITPRGVVCRGEDEQSLEIPTDTVVLAMGAVSQNTLAEQLEKIMAGKVRLIGDANEVANAAQAVEEGFKAGIELN
jgi:2,4-dienoyl-CoA reductase (NADPH2)